MLVTLKSGRDSRPTLACVRADGSRTWSKVHPFFPVHDLTHFAVESVLGFTEAFFGLISAGWDIDTFAEPGTTASLPDEALWAEHIVGVLDLERGMNRLLSTEDFNQALADSFRGKPTPPYRRITTGELVAIRALRGKLSARWSSLSPGETMEIEFPGEQ